MHGLDVHPVAVIIARVTVLLALGQALNNRAGSLTVPVHLGNAMQWDVQRDVATSDLVIEVPPAAGSKKKGAETLTFPIRLCEETERFDAVTRAMHAASEADEGKIAFTRRMEREGVNAADLNALTRTYQTYHKLRRAGRDHIWGYVARNLARPVALATNKMDVILGNPPWLSYRFMARSLQTRFKFASQAMGVWVDEVKEGHLVTQTDLSGYFLANAMRLYLRDGGRLAMVMPLAAMTRGQFRAFRTGDWQGARARFTAAWVLDNRDIEPLFRVPTCVLFAELAKTAAAVPTCATWFFGRLPRKDASPDEARRLVTVREAPAPRAVSFAAGSPYRERFAQGATLVPRMMCYVERVPGGRLGTDELAPLVRSVRSGQEKKPWRELDALQAPVEAQCLRTAYLGASIAPFRVLDRPKSVVPVAVDGDGRGTVLNAERAAERQLHRTAEWLAECERLWDEHGRGRMSFREQIDYQGKLRGQFPVRPVRIVYAKAGVQPAATVLRDTEAVVDHKLYWAGTRDENEAHYLVALLNAETVRARVEGLQSRGEQGARDFDKLFFTLPIPLYDAGDALHVELTEAAREAERVAAAVALTGDEAFTTARRMVRDALAAGGVSGRIDALVDRLLSEAGAPTVAVG